MNVNPTSTVSVQSTDAAHEPAADESVKSIETRLFSAIENGDMDTYRELIHHPAIDVVDAVNSEGQGFLHVAVRSGNAEVALHLIQELDGTSTLDDLDHRGFTPLMYAVEQRRVDLVKALLNAQAMLNVPFNDQYYAMPRPAFGERKQISEVCFPSALQLAVAMYANATDPAIAQQGKEMAELLADAGADASDALMRSSEIQDINTVVRLINDFRADPSQAFYGSVVNSQSNASNVLRFVDADVVKVAISAADRNDHDVLSGLGKLMNGENLAPALNAVVATGNMEAVLVMLADRRNLYVGALKLAQQNGNTAIEQALVEAASASTYQTLNEYAQEGVIAAREALNVGNFAASEVKKFEHLADCIRTRSTAAVKEMDPFGTDRWKALLHFAKQGNVEQTKTLLNFARFGARGQRTPAREVQTIFSFAIEHMQLRLADALLELGPDREKALASAIRSGNRRNALSLVALGVDLNATLVREVGAERKENYTEAILRLLGADYETALVLAATARDKTVATILVDKRGANLAEAINLALDKNVDEGTIDFLLGLENPINRAFERA